MATGNGDTISDTTARRWPSPGRPELPPALGELPPSLRTRLAELSPSDIAQIRAILEETESAKDDGERPSPP